MQEYLLYSPIIILAVWTYLFAKNVKSLQQIKKLSGRSYFYIVMVIRFSAANSNNHNKKLGEAISSHKQLSRRLFKIWVLTLLAYIAITIIVGVLTAKN